MDSFQKYSRLLFLILGSFFSFLIVVIILFFLLRLLSITFFHIPGFDLLYQYIIIIIPYIIFTAAYYYLFKKIKQSQIRLPRIIASILIITGCIISIFTLTVSTIIFLRVKNDWLKIFEENGHYALIIQLVILFATAGILASGDAEEQDWMTKNEVK